MPIEFDAESRTFHLHNGKVSYLLRVLENGGLGHLHFGAPVAAGRPYRHLSGPEFLGFGNRLGDPVALEYPTEGTGDFRMPAVSVRQRDGSTALDLRYTAHRVIAGKPAIAGLPSTYGDGDDECQTLEVLLADTPADLEVGLRFTVFRDHPVVARSAWLRNAGREKLVVENAMSASLDLPDAEWELLHLSGNWARERHVVRRALRPGRQSVGSLRGASGHEHNPFVALVRTATTESAGEALGFSLVYSGNFLAEAEEEPYGTARVRLGINPDGFAWTLGPGERFETPEAVLAWSGDGLGALSDAYHLLYRERLARGKWRDAPRPILLNSWEATYFDFDEARLLEIAASGRDLGIELFVLDDGWFGRRDADTSSLGDWYPTLSKLPDGIVGLARKVEGLGLRFGIWIEPEMVSERSELFAAHPDWAVGSPARPRTQSRSQLVLDMSRPEVVDHLFEVFSELFLLARISYVKWDMNRNITEPVSGALPADRQGEFFHRYMLGLYALYDRLTRAFPDILFESCAGGGGRFDPGLLAYAPQAWTSDDTDAIERLAIQWGTSICYPLSSMGAHVSAVPNHQVGRITPLSSRAAVAFFGVFGYELDPTKLSEDERREVAAQVAWYKGRRDLFQRGRFIRLVGPFEGDGNETAWMATSADGSRAVVGHYTVLNRPSAGPARLRLRGLDPAALYRVTTWPELNDGVARANAGVRGGDELMAIGLVVRTGDREDGRAIGDFSARLFDLEAV